MSANDKQVGGEHYNAFIQHWDYVVANELDYFQAQITKYVTRWKKKNGMTDLQKAQHFLEKYIEVVQQALDLTRMKDTMAEAQSAAEIQASFEDDDDKQRKYDYNRNVAE
jgi:hypothetical protein